MNAYEFGINYLHDQLELMLETDQAYQIRIKELKASRLREADQVRELIDLKKEHELLETEIYQMVEFIGFIRSEKTEFQKKKNAGAEATDKENLTKEIITEIEKNANTYSIMSSNGPIQ